MPTPITGAALATKPVDEKMPQLRSLFGLIIMISTKIKQLSCSAANHFQP